MTSSASCEIPIPSTEARDPLASTSRSPRVWNMSSVRSQTAAVRALLDEIERVTSSFGESEDLDQQLAEELERLGKRLVEVARSVDPHR
jgi:hypothetical protein